MKSLKADTDLIEIYDFQPPLKIAENKSEAEKLEKLSCADAYSSVIYVEQERSKEYAEDYCNKYINSNCNDTTRNWTLPVFSSEEIWDLTVLAFFTQKNLASENSGIMLTSFIDDNIKNTSKNNVTKYLYVFSGYVKSFSWCKTNDEDVLPFTKIIRDPLRNCSEGFNFLCEDNTHPLTAKSRIKPLYFEYNATMCS